MNIGEKLIKSLFPEGAIWEPKFDGDFDKLLQGLGEVTQDAIDYTRTIGEIREPESTPILEDLEREFGVKLPVIEEPIRRARLASRKYVRRRDGTLEQMDFFLQEAGFDLNIFPNDPAVDPANIGTELLVNNLRQGDNNIYSIPTDSQHWPLFIFIGGDATFGGGGEITSVDKADVDIRRRHELRNLIMTLKGMGIWVILRVNLVNPPSEDDLGDPFGIDGPPFGFWGDSGARGWGDNDNPDVGGIYLGVLD